MEALRRSTAGAPPLHTAELSRLAIPNRIFAAIYTVALLFLFYHHFATLITFLPLTATTKTLTSSFFASLLLLAADLVLAFMWATTQSFRMRPLRRAESPELLKATVAEGDFPAMDVFICTADPYKEPPVVVVNTALSVMAYEYPPEKISVYVSDDGGSALTLFAFFEAAKFAAHWLPFCRKNAMVERSPEAFFATAGGGDSDWSLSPEAAEIKNLYESMKAKIKNVVERGKVISEYITHEEESQAFSKWTDGFTRQNHPTVIQVILDKSKDRDLTDHVMPNLIYVSREKSESSFHHFKAGALNALIRVSATMTNAPIILTLDCDMSSNDPQTLFRALCYFSDPKLLQSEMGYVQFPQRFKRLNKNDIYGGEFKRATMLNMEGMDGLLGPNYIGSGCFFNRRAFFGGPRNLVLPELSELGPESVVQKSIQSHDVMKLAHHVISRNYEIQTEWGYKIGVRYGTLVEDLFTGYHLHCEGWKSIFCDPKRPAFYGDSAISLGDVLNQNKRWSVGLLEVAFSKYCPLTFGVGSIGPLMALAYSHYAFWPILSFPIVIYAFLPQLALLHGVPLFPQVSQLWFILYLFLFFGAYGQDFLDFLVGGGTIQKWWNDQRMWLIRGVSSYLFGSIEFFTKFIGISSIDFNVTSKVNEEEKMKRYEKGMFEFGIHSPLIVTLTMVAIINVVTLFWGILMILRGKSDFEKLLIQLLITIFVVVNCRPVYEGVFLRSDKGRIPTKTTMLSIALVSVIFAMTCVTLRD